MAHREAYHKHIAKLVTCLPMDDVHFMTMLSIQKLLPGDMKNKIDALSTQAQKASYFLSHIINPALDIDENSDFENLLTVMQNCDYHDVQRLASTIKLEIDQKKSYVSGTSIIICSTYIHIIMYL